MLTTLTVSNIAVVSRARMDFSDGLNVITGETGAGKSVLLGALGLLLGLRADRKIIRTGEKKAFIEGVLSLADPDRIDQYLSGLGLPLCDEGLLIVRREVPVSGAGRNFINNAAATLNALKGLGELLIDLHGPYDHQALLDREYQLNLIDSFGALASVKKKYQENYQTWIELQASRRALDGDELLLERELEMLRFQVDEIESAELEEGMEEKLQEEFSRAANSRAILEGAAALREKLIGEDRSAFEDLVGARRHLEELSRYLGDAAEWLESLEELSVLLTDLAETISSRVEDIDLSPERESWLEEKLVALGKLKRKYGGTVKDILDFLSQAQARLNTLEGRTQEAARLDREIKKKQDDLMAAGAKLSQARRKAGEGLSRAVGKHLNQLGFAQGSFSLSWEAREPSPAGLDRVEFIFSPNPGEPSRSLRAIASSGEISRVMLALKAVLGEHDRIPVMVFDEIDANVGGQMGWAIGQKLEGISSHRQVLCITHQPQVAVYGKTHLVVSKKEDRGRTLVSIVKVSGDARVEEVARMLGGKDSTSVAWRHAQELLNKKVRPVQQKEGMIKK